MNENYFQLNIFNEETSMVEIARLEKEHELDVVFESGCICPECGWEVIDRYDMYKSKQGMFGHLECLGVDDELGVECDICGRFLLNSDVRMVEYYKSPYDEKPNVLYICPENVSPLDRPDSYKGYCYKSLFVERILHDDYFICKGCKRIILSSYESILQYNYPDLNNRKIIFCLKCNDKVKE